MKKLRFNLYSCNTGAHRIGLKRFILFWVLGIGALSSCALPSLNLSTRDPLSVDIRMRVDVYQYQHAPSKTAALGSTSPSTTDSHVSSSVPIATTIPPANKMPTADTLENRAADLQVFKNSRLVGENHDGFITLLEETPGDYGAYVRKVVEKENAERLNVMKKTANEEKRSLESVEKDQAALWRNRSFTGEWIQQPAPSKEWIQKEK